MVGKLGRVVMMMMMMMLTKTPTALTRLSDSSCPPRREILSASWDCRHSSSNRPRSPLQDDDDDDDDDDDNDHENDDVVMMMMMMMMMMRYLPDFQIAVVRAAEKYCRQAGIASTRARIDRGAPSRIIMI
jgi:hypothetical protein